MQSESSFIEGKFNYLLLDTFQIHTKIGSMPSNLNRFNNSCTQVTIIQTRDSDCVNILLVQIVSFSFLKTSMTITSHKLKASLF